MVSHADEAAAAVSTAFKGGDDLAAGAIAYGDDVGDAAAAACSFTPDTPVATPDGARPIGELAVGDLVTAADPDTGALASRPVAAVLVHPDTVTGTVSIDGERIATTPEHPFAVLGQGFVAAADLVPGDRVLRSDGTTGTVSEIRWDGGPAPMWNLTVAVDHTFFVGEGAWWVHNACSGHGSVSSYKTEHGAAATGNHLDHVVEQSQIGRSGFSPEQIHNTANIREVPAAINLQKAGYYNRIIPGVTGSDTLRVRDWLAGKPFQEQFDFGIKVLRDLGWTGS